MDKCREEFEAWIKSETGFDLYRTQFQMTKYEDQQYYNHKTNLAWLSWKASRENMKAIKLPSGLNTMRISTTAKNKIISAITSAGYKVE